MIKKVLLALVGIVVLLIAILAITSFLTPTDYTVERQVTINKPKADVFNYVKFLKNQNDWGPWFKKDPSMKQTFTGVDGTAGFISHWDSTNGDVGEGEQEIKALTDNERMDVELRFIRPFEDKAQSTLLTEPVGNGQTKVTWKMSGSMPRPMNLMMHVMDMDKMIGDDFASGLSSLKTLLEK